MLNDSSEQRTANSGQRTEKSKQRIANSGQRTEKSKQRTANSGQRTAISNALRRRAQAIINNRSIDAQSRAIIRYALATKDAWLAELVRRADAGETIIYTVNSFKHPHPGKRIQGKRRLKH